MPSVALFGNPWFRAGSGSGGVQYSPTGSAYTVSACKADAGCNVNTAYISQILYNGGITDMTLGQYDNSVTPTPHLPTCLPTCRPANTSYQVGAKHLGGGPLC